MVHKNILIKGRVQGVGFRYSARKQANQVGINGFARNLPDGSVYIEAEGSVNGVAEFIHWCHTGPGRAVIHSVSIEDGPVRQLKSFEITF